MTFCTIYADPPWPEVGGGVIVRGAQAHYDLMKVPDIVAMGGAVKQVSMPNAHLYLWVTNNYLKAGLQVMEAWGFTYKTTLTWAKASSVLVNLCQSCYNADYELQKYPTTQPKGSGTIPSDEGSRATLPIRPNLQLLPETLQGYSQNSEVLQYGLCEQGQVKENVREEPIRGTTPSNIQGIYTCRRIQVPLPPTASDGIQTGICSGTSPSGINDARASIGENGISASPEWQQGRQQARESGYRKRTHARQNTPSPSYRMPTVSSCVHCGQPLQHSHLFRPQNPGLGQYFRGQTEHCLFGVRGMVPYKVIDGKRAQSTTLLIAPRLKHSQKPLEMYDRIEKVSTGPYLELFSRQRREGWCCLGSEITQEDIRVSLARLIAGQ